ncbi:hypothetical protein JB92DRAFT_93338 [Gautieria morchelliformis]|nr:hypothetical protein JB92DRAFT_93338 [Gautieria morchelliformis]
MQDKTLHTYRASWCARVSRIAHRRKESNSRSRTRIWISGFHVLGSAVEPHPNSRIRRCQGWGRGARTGGGRAEVKSPGASKSESALGWTERARTPSTAGVKIEQQPRETAEYPGESTGSTDSDAQGQEQASIATPPVFKFSASTQARTPPEYSRCTSGGVAWLVMRFAIRSPEEPCGGLRTYKIRVLDVRAAWGVYTAGV